jgi:hypothetical protein
VKVTENKAKSIAILTLCFAAYSGAASAKNLVVGAPNTPCPHAQYSTIAAAVTAASSGDVIKICPALYSEQVVITKPLTLQGIDENGVNRVLIQPALPVQPTLPAPIGTLPFIAVISVLNTSDVTIENLVVDAGKNAVPGCDVSLAGIHFSNASGTVENSVVTGTALSTPTSCTTLFPGNGFGVEADQSTGAAGPFNVAVLNSSIHDFGRDAILVNGAAEVADIKGNNIAGIGPSTGVNQFGVFLANGATGKVTRNTISQGKCTGTLMQCTALRSEGVVLRSVGNGVVVSDNWISNVQAGVFVNGATDALVSKNRIVNVDTLNGIHIQQSISGIYEENDITHGGISDQVCGLADIPGSGSSGNKFSGNSVNDAYCGIGYVTGDQVDNKNSTANTLYETLNLDTNSNEPPPVEPGQ